jgi:hypothetical protein
MIIQAKAYDEEIQSMCLRDVVTADNADQDAINSLRFLRARDAKSFTRFNMNCGRQQKHPRKNSILRLGEGRQ